EGDTGSRQSGKAQTKASNAGIADTRMAAAEARGGNHPTARPAAGLTPRSLRRLLTIPGRRPEPRPGAGDFDPDGMGSSHDQRGAGYGRLRRIAPAGPRRRAG